MYDFKDIVMTKNVQDALIALKSDPEAILISGGTDVLVNLRGGWNTGRTLVSINDIKELNGVVLEEDGTIRILPGTTFSGVTHNEIIKKYINYLGEATDQAGGPQLRNAGTIGGNICNGATSADSPPSLLTLNATLEITSLDGVRFVKMEEFYLGPGKVALEHGEILTAILIKKEDYEGFNGHYIKYAMRNAMDIATLGCTVSVKLDESKENIVDMRLAYGVAAPTPIRCHKTEEAVKGKPINDALFDIITETVVTEVNPRTSWRASKEFRIQLVKQLAVRALKEAIRLNKEGK